MKRLTLIACLALAAGIALAEVAPPPYPPAIEAPPTVDPRILAAEQTLFMGKKDAARREIKRFLKENKKSAEAWTLYGRIELEDGRLGPAKKYFDRALKYSPRHAPAFYGKGLIMEKRGRLDEAANEYRAAALADPNHAEANAALDRLKIQAGSSEGHF